MDQNIAIEVKSLSKQFGTLKAVEDLTLTINKGELFGFLGPNGAGKTTSINLICGFLKPNSGHVFMYSGNTIIPMDRSKVGLCPQEITIWKKLTCFEQLVHIGQMYNVAYSDAKKKAILILDKLGLNEKKNKLAGTLSGGMQRRLNIAMALIHDPEIVIFDEPEAGLDPQSRVLVREFIKRLSGEKTIILTTHNMDEADRMCDRLAIIDHGRLLLTDTPSNLKHTIGEGDIIEIETPANTVSPNDELINGLKLIAGNVRWEDGHIMLKGIDLISKIPSFSDYLRKREIKTGEIKLRENSLEDVFISLTGRKLRE